MLFKVVKEEGIINFAYNDANFYSEKEYSGYVHVKNSNHDNYLEAITAAIFFDSNYKTVRKWFDYYLFPLLKKYSGIK